MAQYLPLPDGTSVTIRAGESPQDAWLRAQRMYPEAFGAKPTAKPETTFGGNVREFFKGLAPGAVGLVESAAVGASSLLPQDMEEGARKRIADIAGAAKAPFAAAPGYEEAVGRKLGEAGGSTIPFLALGPAGIAGRVGMAALGTGAGAGEARTRAEEDSTTADQRGTATALGAVVGVSEMFAPLRILGRLSDPIKAGAAAQLKRIAVAGGEEAAQEAAAQIAQNLIAKGVYKPEQAIIEQVGESAAYGGAVGAMAQGLLDLALGRRASKAGTPDEISQARAEADAAKLAEQERKASPEYAQQFVADYETRRDAFVQARAALKNPGNDATPDVRQAYEEQKKALNEMRDTLKDDAREYNALRPQVQQARSAAEEQRSAEVEAAAAGMGEEQTQPFFYEPQQTLPGFGGAAQQAQAEAPAEDFVDYNQQVRLLNDRLDGLRTQAQQTTDLDAKIELGRLYGQTETALQEAQTLLAQQTPVAPPSPDAKIKRLRKEMSAAEETGDVAKQVRLAERLKELGVADLATQPPAPAAPAQAEIPLEPFKTKVSTKAEYNLARLRAQPPLTGPEDIESQERDYLEESERQRQEAMQEAQREQNLAPEVLALRRISQKPALTSSVGQGNVSSLVDQLGDSLRMGRGPVAGRVVSGGVETDMSQMEELRAQLAYARATSDKTRQQELRKQLEDLRAPDDKRSVDDLDFGEDIKQAGVEGRLTPDVMASNRVTRMSQSQLRAYDKLASFVQSVRESDPQMQRTAGEERTLLEAAERLKDVVAGQALLEVNTRRAQAQQEPLSTEKQTELVGRVNNLLSELVFRGAPLFNKTETPAVTRGTLTLRSAETRRPPRGRQVFPNFTAASSSLRAQMRGIMDSVGGIKAPAPTPKQLGPARIATEGLRREPQGRERSIEKQFEAAFDRAKTDEDYRTLKELQRRLKNLSPELQEEAVGQTRRVLTGRALDLSPQLQQSLETSRRAGESDMGQEELFAGTSERGTFRTTANRFIKFLQSGEVAKMRGAVAEAQRVAAFQAKRAATIQRKIDEEAKKQREIIAKLTAPWFENPVEAARKQFKKVVDRNQAATKLAEEINKRRTQARVNVTGQIIDLENALVVTKKNQKEIEELYDFAAREYIVNPRLKASRERLTYFEQQRDIAAQQVEAAQKAVDAGRATKDKLLEEFASDTIDNALLSAGAKAQRKIDRAQQAVRDAVAEEGRAKQRLKEAKAEPKPKEPTVAEMVARTAELDTLRVYRDTADAKVQADVAKERKNIGKAEEAHAAATTNAERAAAIKDIEASYNKVYELLNNAPLRQERMSDKSAAAQKEFDDAQAAAFEQTLKLFEETAGIAPLKMTARRTIASVRDAKTGRVETQVKKESVAQQERRFAKEQETGEYAASTLEKLAKANADLQETQRQINYIDANRAEPRTPARKRQDEARTNAVAKRKEIEAQIKELKTAQKETVAEARTERQAEKELRKESKRMIRRGQGEAEPGVFRTSVKAGPSLKEQTVKRIADKVVADWAITPEIEVVADESGLPENIRAQAVTENMVGKFPGVYDPNTKKVYLVATGLKDASDVVLTLAHEVTGHFGLREMLGGSYSPTMQKLYSGNKLVRERADAKMAENKKLSQDVAVEEVLADMAETGATPQERNVMQRVYDYIRRWLQNKFPGLGLDRITENEVAQVVANARRYVVEGDTSVAEGGTAATSGLLYRTAKYASSEMEQAVGKLDPFVTKQRGVNERVRAASGGFLGLETQLVDRFAGYERLRKYMPELQGSQMIYYLRMYDQRMNMVSQAVGTGAPVISEKTRKDGKVERVMEAQEGPSIKGVVDILKEATPMVGNGEAVNRLFTAYMAAIRADSKGFESLNFGEDVSQEMLNDALSVVNSNTQLKGVFDKARGEYNEYNRNMINFVVDTGALSKKTAARLLAENDYIPFYRERNGVAELLIGNETPIKIGSIKSQPYLQELVGGDKPILDFMTSSVQNTNMLIDMGMRNLATKNAVFELIDLSAAKLVRKAEGPDVVQFKVDGEDRYAVLATERVKIGNKEFDTGVPADILVKGMEGIPTQMPFLFRALAIPAQILRKGVTLSPMYMANQLFRDSLAAPIAAGANFTPVLGALRQIGKPAAETLERRGITGGQQFTGGSDDMAMILRGIADGKPGWMNLLAKAEAVAMSADSLTRRAQYNSYIEQGMSEMEATLLALESMNFNKRGASPSIHIANALIPFFNAQIQGLNVLYKAMTGQMIFNDKLKIRQKLLQRGGMMAAASIVYAIMMQDDEAYKNAEADQKYGKWFVRIPGVDEPVRVPIPFEIGYIFKALPEALVNSMLDEHGGEQAVKAFKQIALQTIPGGSSYGIPQAMKPAIEAGLGKSFYTGRDILSAREKELLPEEQFRNNTAEMSKLIGQVTGTSPIIFENLVRGYTGTVGLAFLHALSLGVPPGESPEKAVKRLSEYPIVGGAFQPNDAGGITNSVYERMSDAQKVERTYEKLVEEGRMAEAKALLQRRGNDMLQAELAKEFKSNMNQLIAAERAIQASDLPPEEKRKQVDQIRKLKIALSKEIRDVADKTVQLSFSL